MSSLHHFESYSIFSAGHNCNYICIFLPYLSPFRLYKKNHTSVMLSTSAVLLSSSFLAAFSPMCLTSPVPEPYPQFVGQPPVCGDSVSWRVDSEDVFNRPAKRAGSLCCDTDGCTLAAGQEHTVGVSVTVGAGLGLDL